jgi:hypothetical protein
MGCRCEESDDWDDDCDCGDECDCGKRDSDDAGEIDDPTMPCPYCGKTIFEDAPQCPHCGQYILADDIPPKAQPWWIVVGVVLCLCAALVWILGM